MKHIPTPDWYLRRRDGARVYAWRVDMDSYPPRVELSYTSRVLSRHWFVYAENFDKKYKHDPDPETATYTRDDLRDMTVGRLIAIATAKDAITSYPATTSRTGLIQAIMNKQKRDSVGG